LGRIPHQSPNIDHTAAIDTRPLSIYLNDHLAGATGGLELARRARGSNRDSEFAAFLSELADEVEADRQTLREVMRRLGVGEDRLKQAVAWGAEKAGRLKLNGSLLSYSPLSRVVELEGLTLGIHGKLALWQTLKRLSDDDRRLAAFDFEDLIARARNQLRRLERQRRKASEEAFQESR
jgi:hypothetical protein